jgi:hypothetical protein
MDQKQSSEETQFRTIQIIAGAVIAGPLIFAAVAFAVARNQQPGSPVLAYIAVGFAALSLIVSFVAPAVVTRAQLDAICRQGDGDLTRQLMGLFQTRVIIRSAVLEGAALLCGVAYITSSLWWTIAAMLLLVGVMLAIFPTRGQFDNWVRKERELRSFGT